MAGWYAARTLRGSTKTVIAVILLAFVLVAAVPAALLVGVVMMLLGHIVAGLALFGGSVLAATAAVVLAGMSGMRHLRKLIAKSSFNVAESRFDVVQLGRGDYTV